MILFFPPSQIVEKLNLVGVEFLWRVIAESRCQKIADMTIQYLLNIRFNYVSAKLKADSLNLHKEFINHCYKRLDNLVTLSRADDYEVEACVVNDKASPPKQVSSVKISQMSSLPPKISGAKLLRLNRLLLLTERYISNIEEAYGSNRTMVPHAASFHGTPITIAVHNEVKKEEFLLQVLPDIYIDLQQRML